MSLSQADKDLIEFAANALKQTTSGLSIISMTRVTEIVMSKRNA